jgi:hypothetical protein
LTTFTSKALRLPLWPKRPLRRREEEHQAEKPLGKSLKRATRALAAKDNTLAGVPRGFPPRAGRFAVVLADANARLGADVDR